ncbi:MAG: hypothetical protein ACP5DX_07470 [Paracoccaceae bacterium]
MILSVLGMAGPTAGAGQTTLPCQGTYQAISGSVTLAAGGVVVLNRKRNEGPVHLTYQGCDRIEMTGGGARMTLVRNGSGGGWTGRMTGRGATRVFRFDALTPRLVTSQMVAVGGGLTVQRGMELTLQQGTENQPTDCIFDAERKDFSLMNGAAEAFMAARGLAPPSADFSMRDYFRARETAHRVAQDSRKGTGRHVSFLLGTGNAILPATRGKTRFGQLCRAGKGALDPPQRMLNFKIFEQSPPQRFQVFAQVIDLQSGKILSQSEAVVEGGGEATLAAAMGQAAAKLEGMGVRIGALSDGRAP